MTKKIIKIVSEAIAETNKSAKLNGDKKMGAKLLQQIASQATIYYDNEKDKQVIYDVAMLIDSDALKFVTDTTTSPKFYEKLRTTIEECKNEAKLKEDKDFVITILNALNSINVSLSAGVNKVERVVHDIEETTIDFCVNNFWDKSDENKKLTKQLIEMYISDMARLLTELKEGYDEL